MVPLSADPYLDWDPAPPGHCGDSTAQRTEIQTQTDTQKVLLPEEKFKLHPNLAEWVWKRVLCFH